MSLFDVIKYGNFDLGDEDALIQLPEEIIAEMGELFWPVIAPSNTEAKISYLVYFYNLNPYEMREVFLKILKELP